MLPYKAEPHKANTLVLFFYFYLPKIIYHRNNFSELLFVTIPQNRKTALCCSLKAKARHLYTLTGALAFAKTKCIYFTLVFVILKNIHFQELIFVIH